MLWREESLHAVGLIWKVASCMRGMWWGACGMRSWTVGHLEAKRTGHTCPQQARQSIDAQIVYRNGRLGYHVVGCVGYNQALRTLSFSRTCGDVIEKRWWEIWAACCDDVDYVFGVNRSRGWRKKGLSATSSLGVKVDRAGREDWQTIVVEAFGVHNVYIVAKWVSTLCSA